jgi:hypothetical protein
MLLPFKAKLLLARAAENLAAHRCSHLLSRSRGILLVTKAPGSRAAPGLKAHYARGPLKVHPKWRLEESAMAPRAVAGPSAIARKSRFVNRATLAALVRGPARHPSHPCPAQKAGPCSDNRASQAAAGIARHT